MSNALYMVQIAASQQALTRFLGAQGLNSAIDQDLGYGTHAWLRATFGKLAPQPFRVFMTPRSSTIKLLGYATATKDELTEYARTFAEPAAQAVCDLDREIQTAEMPGVEAWKPGRELGFEVLATPVARRSRDGRERDFFLHEADIAGPEGRLSRELVYVDWLARHLEPAASLNHAHLERFQLVRHLRLGASSCGVRPHARIIRPCVLMRGQLTVEDAHGFAALLARGVGRHRAFGYGMLLLRPVR